MLIVNLPCAAEAAAQPVAEQPEPEEAAAPAAEVTPAPEPEQPEPEEVAAPAAEVTPAPEPEQPEPEESAAPTAPRMSPKEQMKKGNMSPAQKMAMMEGEIRKKIAFQFPDLSPEAQEEMIQEKLAMIQAKMAGKAAGEPSEPDLPEGCGPDAMSRWGEVMAQTCSCDFFLEETCLPEEKRPYAMAECQQKHLVNLPCAAEAAAQPVAEQPEPEEAA